MVSSMKSSHDLVAIEGADPLDDRYTRRCVSSTTAHHVWPNSDKSNESQVTSPYAKSDRKRDRVTEYLEILNQQSHIVRDQAKHFFKRTSRRSCQGLGALSSS